MYKKTLTKVSERYEAPSIEVLSVSMEGVLCQSGGSLYNQYGLHDFSESDVEDQSRDWNF